jgi:TolB protein
MLLAFHFSIVPSEAKVYIDIQSPSGKKLPVAIQEFTGPFGKEIPGIITDDFESTGFFEIADRAAHIEQPSLQFNFKNWSPLRVEAVVKGSVTEDDGTLTVSVFLYDVPEAREVFRNEYKNKTGHIRQIAHAISNDLYKFLTGGKSSFTSRIAFLFDENGGKSLCLMDWDGNMVTRTGRTAGIIISPRWSPDGNRLIYSAERNRQWGIYMIDFMHMTEEKIFSAKGINIAGDFMPGGNDFVLSSSKDGNPDLYLLNLLTKNAMKLTSSHNTEISPAASPDGRHITFVSDRGGTPQIYLMRKDGSDIRRLTFEGSYNTSASWSPNGDRIVFSGRRNGKNQILVIRTDGTGLVQLTKEGNNEDPSFSPDGRFIAFSSDRDGVKGIYIMRSDGDSQKRISPSDRKASSPRWSPD